jgi:hypothetical protein
MKTHDQEIMEIFLPWESDAGEKPPQVKFKILNLPKGEDMDEHVQENAISMNSMVLLYVFMYCYDFE